MEDTNQVADKKVDEAKMDAAIQAVIYLQSRKLTPKALELHPYSEETAMRVREALGSDPTPEKFLECFINILLGAGEYDPERQATPLQRELICLHVQIIDAMHRYNTIEVPEEGDPELEIYKTGRSIMVQLLSKELGALMDADLHFFKLAPPTSTKAEEN